MNQLASALDRCVGDIERDLLTMADLAVRRTERALGSWRDGDRAAAARVIADDELVDDLCLAIERRVLVTQVTMAPVARDQRLLHVARIACVAFERVGDLASAIADLAGDAPADIARAPRVARRLDHLAELAVDGLAGTREALDAGDAALAFGVVGRAAEAPQALADLLAEVCEGQELGADPALAASVVLLGRHLERLVDNAAMVARRVVFLATGRLPAKLGATAA